MFTRGDLGVPSGDHSFVLFRFYLLFGALFKHFCLGFRALLHLGAALSTLLRPWGAVGRPQTPIPAQARWRILNHFCFFNPNWAGWGGVGVPTSTCSKGATDRHDRGTLPSSD